MGYNESFAEFYPKFHIQINRLKLGDEHKVDELTKRLRSSIPSCPDHSKLELERTDKPLAQMIIQELRAYRNNLPVTKIISDRCMREGRCHTCHQKGHMKSNPSCPLKRLDSSSPSKSIAAMETDNHISDSEKDSA
ncbi:hypothetical protein OnM2_105003 [Erysiphe neolycopersici]|uniref:Uncharacterized protein n=1 Tax=Erysiphe neolycopersici TaxID=212602 RepID=A0A420H7Q2_9PEZI|nr:hypothetical protein OnM2_105003 [Erysiphe neolycopersici]